MIIVASTSAINAKYGADAANVLTAISVLGPWLEASNMTPEEIRLVIDAEDPSRTSPALLIGGYDLVPTFRRPNPTRNVIDDPDVDVMSDGPYGARVGDPAEEYLPTRAVSRIPDSEARDTAQFLAILNQAASATTTDTPTGSFHLAAKEFEGSAGLVRSVLAMGATINLSPPDAIGAPAINAAISSKGCIHFLLHGSDRPDRWARLYGAEDSVARLRPAVRISDLKQCTLKGAIVSFSTCYSAMLDAHPGTPPRDADNQPALACLVGGAKTVYGSTRANWIDDTEPFDSFGSALIASTWRLLIKGESAAEALRRARFAFAEASLTRDAWSRPFVLKTLLQAQCFGHPLAKL